MLKVLIVDKLPDSARTRLQEVGCEVVQALGLKADGLVKALGEHNPDVLVVRSTQVTAEHMIAAPGLQLIVRAGAGVNTIDAATASERGIFVTNCPGMNAVAVAELAWGHILNADRRIADAAAEIKAGKWRKKEYSIASGLKGRTLGVIGCGAIGREMIKRAHAFDMKVAAFDPALTPEQAAQLGVLRCDSAVEVARRSKVLTVHVALSRSTRGFIGEAIFQALPKGATFVNTSRGEVVDEAALIAAIKERGLRAGLDVFAGEPEADGEWSTEIASLPGVWGTPHVGASTDQAQEAVADEAVRIIQVFQSTGSAPNCVNLADKTPATHMLVVRHEDRVGVLASLLEILREASINVQGMENIVFSGAKAACARIQLDTPPDAATLARMRGLPPIFDVKLVAI